MENFTATEARKTANESGWLRSDAMSKIQAAAKQNKAFIKLDFHDVSSVAADELTEYLVSLGYSTLLDDGVFTIRW